MHNNYRSAFIQQFPSDLALAGGIELQSLVKVIMCCLNTSKIFQLYILHAAALFFIMVNDLWIFGEQDSHVHCTMYYGTRDVVK